MLDFNLSETHATIRGFLRQFARDVLRPASVEYDRREHEKPMDVLRQVQELMQTGMMAYRRPPQVGEKDDVTSGGMGGARSRGLTGVILGEEVGYGAASLVLSFPGPGLAGAAILATGTDKQKEKWLARYHDNEVRWGAMAVTEPGCGSDVGAIKTTAVREGDHWVLNGRKIFCTNGASADITVVWATVDPSRGKEGIRAFVIEKGTPGFSVGRLEKKLGIRSSETAELVLDNCKLPLDAVLGEETRPAGEGPAKGFKGVMATFDSTRPGVAALAIGIARASFEYLQERLAEEGYLAAPYGRSRSNIAAIDDALIELEAQIEAARLLAQRAAWMIDQKIPNALEASMAKAKAGKVVVEVCAKAVELLGPEGVTRKHPVEMWLRDSKVFDIFEGTGQINRLVIARRILGYSSKELS